MRAPGAIDAPCPSDVHASMLLSLIVIVLFDLAGEVASRVLHVPLPGPVVGMLLLFGALVLRGEWSARIARGGDFLLRWMALFFVPAGVGVVTQLSLLKAEWLAVCVALVASTVIGLASAAAAFAWLARRGAR